MLSWRKPRVSNRKLIYVKKYQVCIFWAKLSEAPVLLQKKKKNAAPNNKNQTKWKIKMQKKKIKGGKGKLRRLHQKRGKRFAIFKHSCFARPPRRGRGRVGWSKCAIYTLGFFTHGNQIAEDQYATALMHDPNLVFKVKLHKAPMRHRNPQWKMYYIIKGPISHMNIIVQYFYMVSQDQKVFHVKFSDPIKPDP